MNDSRTAAPEDGSKNNEDKFISLQLIPLLLLPGTVVIISDILSICGLSSDQVDAVRGLYITPVFLLSFATGLMIPILFLIFVVYMGVINIIRGHRKKAATFFVMIGLNILAFYAQTIVDIQYLRFMVQKHGYELKIANSRKPGDGSQLFVFDFDSVQDNFYFGGANFLPYKTVIVFDESDEISKPERSRSSEWQAKANAFSILSEIGPVKHFGGHYYFASTATF